MKIKIQLFIIFCLAVSLITFGSGCAKKEVKEEISAAEIAAQQAAERERAEREAAERKAQLEREAAEKKAQAEREAEAAAEAAKKRAQEEAAQRRLQQEINAFESEKIYFDFDKADLKPEAQATLEKKARFLEANLSYSVRIEGNCDERGTNEYNLALGDRRADAAKKYLSSLGISAFRIKTVSYGEEKPVDTGHNEAAWSKNRRDEFKLVK